MSARSRNRTRLDALGTQLDAGETEVIALCAELAGAVAVLDDKRARRLAQEMGLKVMGTVGLLLNAKRWGLLSELRPDSTDDNSQAWNIPSQ